jgi:membrane protease YdiL (CAAX protease family)
LGGVSLTRKPLAQFLFVALVFGALLGNVWEETAWAGFVQRRLTNRHGLFAGAMLTAVPFALIHLPFAFEEHGLAGTSARDMAITWGVLIIAAPFMRYLIGMVMAETGGSLLAAGVLHGSFNASAALSMLSGGWQYVPAMMVLTVLVAAYRRWIGPRSTSRPSAWA